MLPFFTINPSWFVRVYVSMHVHTCADGHIKCMHTCTLRHTHIHTHKQTHEGAYTHTCTPTHRHTILETCRKCFKSLNYLGALQTATWQYSPLTLVHMAWHTQIRGWAMEITPWFECSSFQCGSNYHQSYPLHWVRIWAKLWQQREKLILPTGGLNTLSIQVDFIYMEGMLSIRIYSSDSISILRITEVHTCAKVAWLIYFKDKITVLE